MAAIEQARGRGEQEQTADFRKIRNKDNDWLIDRHVQKHETYTVSKASTPRIMRSPKAWNRSSIAPTSISAPPDRAIVIGRHLLIPGRPFAPHGKELSGVRPSVL